MSKPGLEAHDNWGNVTYTFNGQPIPNDEGGIARVKWPDGTTTRVSYRVVEEHGTWTDHAQTGHYVSKILATEMRYRGFPFTVKLIKLEVLEIQPGLIASFDDMAQIDLTKALTVYELKVAADCEGRSTHAVGLFMDRDDALAVHATGYLNQGMGGPGDPKYATTEKQVFPNVQSFVDAHPDMSPSIVKDLLGPDVAVVALRDRALAKLTPEERDALTTVGLPA